MENVPAVVQAAPNLPPMPVSRPALKPLSTEGSVIPGETEEDGLLRREYVLVGDTQAVEFNRAVDGDILLTLRSTPKTQTIITEITAARRRPLIDRRAPLTPASAIDSKRSPDALHLPSPESPSGLTFPPPQTQGGVPIPAGRSATNALSRALSLASKKLFGASLSSPHSLSSFPSFANGEERSSPSPRMRTASIGTGEIDPVEDELLGGLEQLAQKTHVITRWADEMYEFVKNVPQSASPLIFLGALSSDIDVDGGCGLEPLPDPSKFAPREGENEKHAARRRNADVQAEYNAVTCVAIYMLVMQFSQKGIDELRKYQEHMEMRYPDGDFVLSDGFDEGAPVVPCTLVMGDERRFLTSTQRYLGSRTTFYGVMTAQRSSRRGYPHSTQGLPPGLTSSCTTARSHWYTPFPFPPFTFSH